MTPTVSVLVTVHNGERFVAEAVGSALTEDVDLEVVVVDDGSSDGSAAAVEAVGDARVVLVRQRHRGRAAALDEALARARGRYVAVLDADDVALPGRLAVPVQFLDEHPDVVLVGAGAWVFVDTEGTELGRRPVPATDDEGIRRVLARQYAPFPHSSMTARTDAVLAVDGYDPDLAVSLDIDLYVRLATRGRLAVIPEPLVVTRRHPGQHFAHRRGASRSLRRRLAARRTIDRRAAAAFGRTSSRLRVAAREVGSWAYWRARTLLPEEPVLSPAMRRRLDRLWSRG